MKDEATNPIKLRNGARLQYGQYFGERQMQQRKLNSTFNKIDPRNGAPKRVQESIAPSPGHYRQTSDSFFTGPGQSHLDDEPNLPIKSHAKPIPVHDGMSNANEVHPVANDPKEILADAARLGRKPKS